MKNKIVWEKWIDPFLTNLDEIELPDDDEEEEKKAYRDSYERAEAMQRSGPKRSYTGPVMVGPMGMIPLNEHNTPSKVYCFWMGHTNFNISPTIAAKIANVPGVEALDIFTRYRFRVAIGKAFLDTDKEVFGGSVLKAISEEICHDKIEQKTEIHSKEATLTALKNYLKSKKYPFWGIYGKSDGEYKFYYADSKEGVTKQSKETEQLVATSWE